MSRDYNLREVPYSFPHSILLPFGEGDTILPASTFQLSGIDEATIMREWRISIVKPGLGSGTVTLTLQMAFDGVVLANTIAFSGTAAPNSTFRADGPTLGGAGAEITADGDRVELNVNNSLELTRGPEIVLSMIWQQR